MKNKKYFKFNSFIVAKETFTTRDLLNIFFSIHQADKDCVKSCNCKEIAIHSATPILLDAETPV